MHRRISAFVRSGWFWLALVVVAVAAGWYLTRQMAEEEMPPGIAWGNGRVEAVAIDISALTGGRIREIRVQEGETVAAGDVLVHMDTQQLEAQLREAQAQLRRGRIARDVAESGVAQAEAERSAALAVVAQRETELRSAEGRLNRSQLLVGRNAISQQTAEDDRAHFDGARAALDAARAQVAAAEAGVATAKARIVDAEATIEAAEAAIEHIQADIDDSALRAPRDGRVQYLVAQPGEVIAGGGRVLNLIDLDDVYMTVFLPTMEAGRLAIGTQARIVLDTAPGVVIPAQVSFISDVAQFTPRTVETAEERQGMMFRVRVRVPPELLRRHAEYVKPGMSGVAYVRIAPSVDWPERLRRGLLE